jgi:hypothetical protein
VDAATRFGRGQQHLRLVVLFGGLLHNGKFKLDHVCRLALSETGLVLSHFNQDTID